MIKNTRINDIELSEKDFRKIGYQLINDIPEFIDQIDERKVTKGLGPQSIQKKNWALISYS